ncbi:isopentenyl-diphosphate delta-isomerase [Amycolatopsis antarctica]|uniref:Isopentenyl-diphosphate Delta-isomerase n=1 Tax=Amycolatopsis antarctica TaxID=1854586 RepID=A0A263D3Q6_9PSEU|nr:isopentenyl-diphosphate Delta-isomerase [Amycolatopsis antarctica]OZM72257.1 isopentenyl-diphosphate delta-isomerase [Amycolatopsis antarctica]
MEQVVLLDESGRSTGTQAKASVHHADTPLHLAFSCYLFDEDGRFLLTRRAESKRTWPGVWTNSCCGHPAPGEELAPAVRRRLGQELGLDATAFTVVLPAFRYQARMADGTLENEMCPVFRAYTTGSPAPDPAEVAETSWVDWADFRDQVLAGERDVSPWCAMQVAELDRLGPDVARWPEADAALLPPAIAPAR